MSLANWTVKTSVNDMGRGGKEIIKVISQLCFRELPVHELHGEHGRKILEAQAILYNEEGYEPAERPKCRADAGRREKSDWDQQPLFTEQN